MVDDASRDATARVVARLAAADLRIRYCCLERPSGAQEARNFGAAEAKGEYLAFLDSDDIWYPEKLQWQVDLLRSAPEVEVVGCHFEKVGADGVSLITMRPAPIVGLLDLAAYNVVGPTSALLVRRAAFREIGGFDTAMPSCQDWELLSRLAIRGNIRNVQDILVAQGVSASSRITRDAVRVVEGHRAIHRRMRLLCAEAGLGERLVRARQVPAYLEILLRHRMFGEAAKLTCRHPSLRAMAKWARMLGQDLPRLYHGDRTGRRVT